MDLIKIKEHLLGLSVSECNPAISELIKSDMFIVP